MTLTLTLTLAPGPNPNPNSNPNPNQVDVLINACGHTLCHVCVRSVGERCPFCRKEFEATSRFYWGS